MLLWAKSCFKSIDGGGETHSSVWYFPQIPLVEISPCQTGIICSIILWEASRQDNSKGARVGNFYWVSCVKREFLVLRVFGVRLGWGNTRGNTPNRTVPIIHAMLTVKKMDTR